MPTEDTLVVNDYGLTQRTRTNASGATKQRFTVSISSDRVLVNTNPKALGKAVTEAIAKLFRERITGIGAEAAPATLKARAVAKRALERGASWATKRYAGGKTGAMAPGSSDALFNDSGRLAKTITVGASGDAWTVNVAANRFDPSTLDHGGTSALRAIVDRLRDFLPELGDPEALMSALPVRRAITDGMRAMITKVQASAGVAGIEIAAKLLELANEVDEAAS